MNIRSLCNFSSVLNLSNQPWLVLCSRASDLQHTFLEPLDLNLRKTTLDDVKAQSHVALVVAVNPVANSLYMLGITTFLVFNTYSNL
jgi:hypothetical protein